MSEEEKTAHPYGTLDRVLLSVGVVAIFFMSGAIFGAVQSNRDRGVRLEGQQKVIINNQRQLRKDLEQINENVLTIR
jgi:hypothetical protein